MIAFFVFIFDLAMAIYNVVLGYMTVGARTWYFSLFAIYLILGFLRFLVIKGARKRKHDLIENINIETKTMIVIGILLILMVSYLNTLNSLSLAEVGSKKKNLVTAFVTGGYLFIKLILSLIKAFKKKKKDDNIKMMIRYIGYANVAISLFVFQKSLLSTLQILDSDVLATENKSVGSLMALLILIAGIRLIVSACKQRKPIKKILKERKKDERKDQIVGE